MTKKEIETKFRQIDKCINKNPVKGRVNLLELLGNIVNSDRGIVYSIVMKNDVPYSTDITVFGPEEFNSAMQMFEGINMAELFEPAEDGETGDTLIDNPYFGTGFSIGETSGFKAFKGYKTTFLKNNIKSILGSYLFIDDELAGWFGVYRTFDEKSFSKKDLAAAKKYEDDFVRIFTETIKINPWHLPESGAFGILDGKGRVTSSSAEAPDWFAKGLICRELRDSAKTFLESDLNS
ncbi:MAG: hypothetical protein JXR95_00005, partial [Deltaproteobacteria bacterium]|nr:hypothetical protein [Deltaproteobacteria bacterium]